jgi:hypothetical protein
MLNKNRFLGTFQRHNTRTKSVDSGVKAQICDYRANQQAKFQN